jgi:hypothetical protein
MPQRQQKIAIKCEKERRKIDGWVERPFFSLVVRRGKSMPVIGMEFLFLLLASMEEL